ncbi:MAG TPA: NADAR family protein, partial [Ktedonobacterales bacterium]
TDLKVYADGMIDCWGLVDLATFRQKVASGWVATSYPQGAQASAHLLASWRFDQPESWLTQEQLIAEVADEIEHLAGRPTAADRCRTALDRYLDEPSDVHRAALRAAYLAVPEHLRLFLGDQDTKDYPLRALITPVGEVLVGEPPDESDSVVQPPDHEEAWAYFQGRREEQRQPQAVPPPWEDDPVAHDPSVIRFDRHDGGHPYLANGYPAPITVPEGTFPTVEHAYWALSTTDHETREQIAHAPTAKEARQLAQGAPHRPDWSVVRLAVMLRLVREKFHQHPDLADHLLATGDGRLIDRVGFSRYWSSYGSQGRNWLGRLLELVRAELRESTDRTTAKDGSVP